MDFPSPPVALGLTWLLVWAVLYVAVLVKWRYRWEPYWTWVTVTAGSALIWFSMWGIELAGERLTAALLAGGYVVCGAPIIAWQLTRWWLDRTIRTIRNGYRNGHRNAGD